MDNPIYITLGRQVNSFSQMNVISNNAANVSTGAYKKDKMLFTTHIANATPEIPAYHPKNRKKQAEFGDAIATQTDFSVGNIKITGRSLDTAINGKNAFFSVETPLGIRYSKTSQFFIDAEGRLTTKEGYPVMGGAGNEPIFMEENDSDITILEDGTITSKIGGVIEERGNITISKFANLQELKKVGSNFYETEQIPDLAVVGEDFRIIGGALEESNASPIHTMTELIELSRSVGGNARFMQDLHDLTIKTIEQVGGVR